MRWRDSIARRLEVWRPTLTRVYSRSRTAVMRWRESASRHFEVWRSAWEDQRKQRCAVGLTDREAEFLPAVLEIQDSPPSPVGRGVGGTIMAVFAAGILWASLGHIDIVAVAPGKIIPSGYSKVIQPFENAVVRAIRVRDGQSVNEEPDGTADGHANQDDE